MKEIKGKMYLVVLFFIMFVAGGATIYNPPQQGPGKFKNLKILPQNISKDSLDMVMDEFKMALGVKCNYCHAASKDSTQKRHLDFASDEKDEKNTARYMFKMTADINANFFNFDKSTRPDTIRVITCYTCHRGIPEPDMANIKKQMPSLFEAQPMGQPPGNPGHKE